MKPKLDFLIENEIPYEDKSTDGCVRIEADFKKVDFEKRVAFHTQTEVQVETAAAAKAEEVDAQSADE